jgi:hypothetical protein
MVSYMILKMPFQTTAGTVRRLRISLPLVPGLLDGQKYFLPDTLPAPVGEKLRPMLRPRMKAPRAPSLRYLVRHALRCQSAEEFARNSASVTSARSSARGIKTGPTAADEARLDRLLGQD